MRCYPLVHSCRAFPYLQPGDTGGHGSAPAVCKSLTSADPTHQDVGRIIGNFHFSVVPIGTYGVNISSLDGQISFVFFGREIRHSNITYSTHVALRCACSIPVAERLDLSAVGIAQLNIWRLA